MFTHTSLDRKVVSCWIMCFAVAVVLHHLSAHMTRGQADSKSEAVVHIMRPESDSNFSFQIQRENTVNMPSTPPPSQLVQTVTDESLIELTDVQVDGAVTKYTGEITPIKRKIRTKVNHLRADPEDKPLAGGKKIPFSVEVLPSGVVRFNELKSLDEHDGEIRGIVTAFFDLVHVPFKDNGNTIQIRMPLLGAQQSVDGQPTWIDVSGFEGGNPTGRIDLDWAEVEFKASIDRPGDDFVVHQASMTRTQRSGSESTSKIHLVAQSK